MTEAKAPEGATGLTSTQTAVALSGLSFQIGPCPWACAQGFTLPSLRDYGNGATRAKRCNTGLTKQCKFKTDASRQD